MAKEQNSKKLTFVTTEKSFDEENLMVTGVIGSDDSLDRHGDKINPKGWDLENYQKNPVILLNHDYWSLPIAKAVNVKRVKNELRFDIQFSKTYDVAVKAFNLLKEGILNAWSVGFLVKEWGKAGGEYTIEKMELLELSLVTVPANPNALTPRSQKSLEELITCLIETPDVQKSAEKEANDEVVSQVESEKNDEKEIETEQTEPEAKATGDVSENSEVVDTPTDEASEKDSEEKIIENLLQSDKLKSMIELAVEAEVKKEIEARMATTIKETESDESEASDPQLLLLTSLREELRATDKVAGKALNALNQLLTSQKKD